MTQKIQLEIDLEIDLALGSDGTIQLEVAKLKKLISATGRNDSDQTFCFLTGKPKAACQCSECTRTSFDALVTPRRKKRDKIEVVFTHPRDPSSFTAVVNSECTGGQAIAGLVLGDAKGPFIDQAPPGRPYGLAVKRTGSFIAEKMTLAEAGVLDGEVIEVQQSGQGGGVPWEAIQLSLAYGVGTGAGLAIVKALTPILQQIVANRGSRSVEIEVAGKRVKIVGKNSIKEVVATIKELANSYGLDEAPESKKTSRVEKKETRDLKSRAAKVRRAGPLPTTRSLPQRSPSGKRKENTMSAGKQRKKNS